MVRLEITCCFEEPRDGLGRGQSGFLLYGCRNMCKSSKDWEPQFVMGMNLASLMVTGQLFREYSRKEGGHS